MSQSIEYRETNERQKGVIGSDDHALVALGPFSGGNKRLLYYCTKNDVTIIKSIGSVWRDT